MKTSRLLIIAAMAMASTAIGNSMPPDQEPQQKSRIDVSRTVNDIARGVKRTPPRYSLAPEVEGRVHGVHTACARQCNPVSGNLQ